MLKSDIVCKKKLNEMIEQLNIDDIFDDMYDDDEDDDDDYDDDDDDEEE